MSAHLCRACGSPRVTLRGKKHGEFIRREFEFYRCDDCGFMFVEPFSGYEIYNDAYYRGHGPDPYVDYETEYNDWRRSDRGFEFEDLFRIAEQRLKDQQTKSPKDHRSEESRMDPSSLGPFVSGAAAAPLRWLDFGCGAGAFLKFLRERGTIAGRPLALSGHDVGSYADLLRTRDGFRILDFEALAREPDGAYDIISMIEVIEHLPEPRAPLALVSRLLKPGGLLLLTTGNLESPIARRQGIHYRYCAPEIHVSLFNPPCLERLYRSVGLEPYRVRYRGAVKFKVVKSLRHQRALRAIANVALSLPGAIRAVDALYGVSAMPCAIKPR